MPQNIETTDSIEVLRQKVNANDASLADHTGIGLATSDSVTNHITAAAGGAHGANQIAITDAGSYYTGTNVETALQEIGAGGIGGGGGGDTEGADVDILIHPTAGAAVTYNIGAGTEEIRATTANRLIYRTSLCTEARIIVNTGGTAPPSGTAFRIQYSTDQSTWNYLNAAGSGPTVTADTASTRNVGAWVTLDAGAKGDVYLRVVSVNPGAAGTSNNVGNIRVQFKAPAARATAATTTLTDAGGHYTAENVEDALQEVGDALGSVGTHAISAHTDVDFATVAPIAGDTMRFNGTDWVPVARAWTLAPHSYSGTISAATISGDSVCTENNFELRRISARVQTPSSSGNVVIDIYRGTSGTGSPTLTLIGTVTVLANQYRAVNLGLAGGNVVMAQDEFLRAVITSAGTGAAGLSIFYRGFLL